jgi:ribonuclease HI
LLYPDEEVGYVIATPAPPTASTPTELHIILFQRVRAFECPSIVTSYDNGILQGKPYTAAVLLPAAVTREEIIRQTGKSFFCPPHLPSATCSCFYDGLELLPAQRFPNRNGYTFILMVHRQLPPNFWDEDFDGLSDAAAASSFLQTHAHIKVRQTAGMVAHTQRPFEPQQPSQQAAPAEIRIPMTEVRYALEKYDQGFLLPCYHLPEWINSTFWTQTLWDCRSPVTDLWIYHDGSHRDNGAGAAAVAFLRCLDATWVYGGAVSLTLPADTTSYGAELRGGVLAVQFGIDILKVTTLNQTTPPAVCLLHDNTSVGNQIFGQWHANADFHIAGIGRHLLIYAEHRFRNTWTTQYVAGHQGDIGNELADSIAGIAADGHPCGDTDVWFRTILAPSFGQQAAWFWLLYSPQFQQWWDGLDLCLPSQPTSTPTAAVLPLSTTLVADSGQAFFDCIIGTCNVLTLRATSKHDDADLGLLGPTRQQIIFQQFLDARVCLFALQETRLRQCHKSLCGYLLFRGDASAQGHHGIIIAISTTIPYGHFTDATGQRRDLLFSQQDVSVVCAHSRYVILRLQTPWVRCLVIAGHAPHTGHDPEEIEKWWIDLRKAIPRSLIAWPIVLLVDANARVGDDTCDAIGSNGAERGGERALPFTSFIREHGLWLPSTFPCHVGFTGTWRHSSGSWHRNDYVCLPKVWPATACCSWTAEDIDVSLHQEDHRAALVRLQMPLQCSSSSCRTVLPKCQLETADLSWLRSCPPPNPGFDVHSHASAVQDQVLACLPRTRRVGPAKLKQTMSETTWALVQDKRKWRQTLHEATSLQRATLLHAFFVAWRQLREPPAEQCVLELFAPFDALLSEQDRLIAKALAEFRSHGRLVTKHSRQDDIHFFQAVMEEGSHFLGPQQSRDLWKVIKRALPKYRQRRLAVDPLKLTALEAEWNPHFDTLEAGCVVDPERLLSEVARSSQSVSTQNAPTIADLPTLFELEHALRANRPGRATGNDPLPSALFHNQAALLAEHAFPLMLKMWIWGEEPIQYKGGPKALIPKVPQPVEVKHFRGILLLPTLAKSFHALLRKRVINLLDHRRLPGQLGGFAGQEVLFGSQALRILGKTAIAKGLSIGVLFVDLSTAFHCLIREMVVGVADHHKLQYVLDALHWTEDPASRLSLGQALPCLFEQLGAPAYLIRLLRNIHDSTWTTINGKEFIRTHRGTRPGSPLADAIFHFIMHDVSNALRAFLLEHGHAEKFARYLSMEADMIIWSDDLAVPIIEEHAADLIPSLLHLLDFVKQQFAQRGFQINLNKGKTGIVATFCGADAAAARRQYQLIPQPGTMCDFSEGPAQFVHITPAYRHLGTLYTSDQNLETEISHRIGIARSAFEQIRRRLLVNRHLPLKLRLQLFGSLILSKFYFAVGSWHTPTGRQIERMRTALGRMVKAMLGPAHRFQSTTRLLSQAGVLDPRVRLAIERLLYAQRLYHHGPAFLQLMTHAEAAQHPFSWLTGLQHDLRWLYGVEATADPRLIAPDMTELIDGWQQGNGQWRARIRRAGQRHLFQDLMILEVQQWHADIFQLLRQNAFTFDPDPALLHLQERQYQCPDCDRCFTTPQVYIRTGGRSTVFFAWSTTCLTPPLVQHALRICGVLRGFNNTSPTCHGMGCLIRVLHICSRLVTWFLILLSTFRR